MREKTLKACVQFRSKQVQVQSSRFSLRHRPSDANSPLEVFASETIKMFLKIVVDALGISLFALLSIRRGRVRKINSFMAQVNSADGKHECSRLHLVA